MPGLQKLQSADVQIPPLPRSLFKINNVGAAALILLGQCCDNETTNDPSPSNAHVSYNPNVIAGICPVIRKLASICGEIPKGWL